MTSGVRLDSLTKRFGPILAVDRLSLDIAGGSFLALLGPSGCGKTTTLRMVVGLETPTGGTIHIDGEDVTRRPPGTRGAGLVFQDFAVFPHMTVRDNLGFAPRMAGHASQGMAARVAEVAEMLELGPVLERRPAQLNPSELQRVAIGRTLAARPRVILFDEPLSNVEARLRWKMRGDLKRLHRRFQQTAIYVTHDQVEALALADTVAVMNGGRVVQAGSPREVYDDPHDAFVASFIGSPPMNLLTGEVVAARGGRHVAAGSLLLPAPADVPPQTTLRVGVRPEHLVLGAPEPPRVDLGQAAVDTVEPLGPERLVLLTGDGWDLTAVVDDTSPAAVGDRVAVSVDPADVRWFAGDGARIRSAPEPVSTTDGG